MRAPSTFRRSVQLPQVRPPRQWLGDSSGFRPLPSPGTCPERHPKVKIPAGGPQAARLEFWPRVDPAHVGRVAWAWADAPGHIPGHAPAFLGQGSWHMDALKGLQPHGPACGWSSPTHPRPQRPQGSHTVTNPTSLTKDAPSRASAAVTGVRRKDEPFAPTGRGSEGPRSAGRCCGSQRPKLCSPCFLIPSAQDRLPPHPPSPSPTGAALGGRVWGALTWGLSARTLGQTAGRGCLSA